MSSPAAVARAGFLRVRAAPGALPLGAIFATMAAVAGLGVRLAGLDRLPFTVCYFKALTGWPCLTCGSTRALAHLVRLDLAGAVAMNPLVTLGLLALLPWGIADLVLMREGRALSLEVPPPAARVVRASAVVLIVANWAYLLAAGR